MKAIVRAQYGSQNMLHFVEVATPSPADNEVLIKLCAASVNHLDLFLMKGMPWNRTIPGLRTPNAEVIAVCSTRNVDKARSLGADRVIDYAKQDFADTKERYDLILGVNAHHSIFEYRRALTPNGIYVAAGGGVGRILQAFLLGPVVSLFGRKKMGFFLANINQRDLGFLKDHLAGTKMVSVIDRRYPLSDAAAALRYLAEGHAQGKVVLTV